MDKQLRCHHCGSTQGVPTQCPTCGNQDLAPFGRGTQRIEETLQHLLPMARLLRIDADTTRNKGQAEAAFEAAHAGQADILIGTQMIAKGHDFKNVKLVVALNVDAALFSSQARAPERLFAQLMQVAGRAGRHGTAGHMLIQTRFPEHSLFKALQVHDYVKFAQTELELRRQSHMPPFAFLALLRADHKSIKSALEFLRWASEQAQPFLAHDSVVRVCDPVPLNVVKVAGVERAQLLIESSSRPALHRFLSQWLKVLWGAKGSVRWYLEIDPQEF
jgi:primosomal protein N' (replication factor Y)